MEIDNNKLIEYIAERYGVDQEMADSMLDMVAVSIQELLQTGHNITIDEIGTFISHNNLNDSYEFIQEHKPKHLEITFEPSDKLLQNDVK